MISRLTSLPKQNKKILNVTIAKFENSLKPFSPKHGKINDVLEFLVNGIHTFFLTPSAQASLSVCKFSLHYPHKISCLVMRIK